MLRKSWRHEQGQSVVLIALMMVGIVMFMGLIIDGGRAYAVRRQAQNAADGAAMAATRELEVDIQNLALGNDTPIQATMDKYAFANGVTDASDIQGYYLTDSLITVSGSCSGLNGVGVVVGLVGVLNPTYRGVRVYTTMRYSPFFVGILFGNQPINVTACATAKFGPVNIPRGLQPVIVPRCYVDPTGDVTDPALVIDPLLCGSNPTTTSHVIQGGGPSSGLANFSDFREVINLNDRESVPPTSPCFSPSCTDLNDVANPNFSPLPSCGDKQGTKQDAKDYIANGGYFGQCGPLAYPTWLATYSGDTNGNAGAIQYEKYYFVGQIIYTAEYQECAQETPTKLPPQCGAFKKAGGGSGCGSFCDVQMIGFAAMKITKVLSNEVDGIWAGYQPTLGDLCLSGCPVGNTPMGVTLVQ